VEVEASALVNPKPMRQPGPSGFGTLLRRLRLEAGLSQEALAERARISSNAVGALELGNRRAPYRETVDQLIEALNPSPEDRSRLIASAQAARTRGPRAASENSDTVSSATLPTPPTRLIGRTSEIALAAGQLSKHRLVTLVGAGGVGKTRVALSVAQAQASEFRDGTWFVDLAAISDAAQVTRAIAAAIGIAGAPEVPIAERVAEFLHRRQALLVLDNCEHVVDAAASFASVALRQTRELRILATSREPLRTGDEAVCEIPVLECPPVNGALTAAVAMQYSAVELFADRASGHDTTFALTGELANLLANIVRRLDGLPLAIELAAARVRALGVAELDRRLDRRFELLAGGDRAAPSRQQTMRALIDWSYNLLSAQEKLLFRSLSIFVGGWSLDAAESVCSNEGAPTVLEGLASLVDKSLVARYQVAGKSRYRLLESTRAFALEIADPELSPPPALRHARWVRELLLKANERSATESMSAYLPALLPEVENIRAGLLWCERARAYELGGQIASLIADLFYWYGFSEEGARWVARFLEHLREDENLALVARLCATLARLTSDAATRLSASERAVHLAERVGEERLLASAFTRYAFALYLVGRVDEALAANDRACALLRRDVQDPNLRIGWVLAHRSSILVELGRRDDARACIADATNIFMQLNAQREALGLSVYLAELEFADGEAERALQIVDEAIPVAAEIGDPENESVFICNRAGYLLSLGDFVEAEATAREAVVLAAKTFGTERVLHALGHLAAALAARGDTAGAAILAGFVEAGYGRSGYQRETTERSSYAILTAALAASSLSEEDRSRLKRRGAGMTQPAVLEAALKGMPPGSV
jgi:predicted ATPase/transcriptional regulator with XRE-family HTH domain